MKARNTKRKRVNVVTLGCSKNIYDSEILMGQLNASGFPVEHENPSPGAGIVIINTCGFIDNAKQESIDTILRYTDAKNKGFVEKVYVTGCLSERYRGDLEKEMPEVDAFFGTRDLPRLLKTLKADYRQELIGERLLTTPAHYAYLKISEGCDRTCSFCAIPLMRGKHLTVPVERLIAEAKSLAAKGVKELILIAQDLTYYGIDLYGQRKIADLLRALSSVEGIEWIRLHYAFPSGFPEEILDVMNERENICKYLDIPLQHISDKLLKSMRRGTNRKKTMQLINTVRKKVPGITLRTTLITGYPGETEKDFNEMGQWVRETGFDRLGVFTYSHEENTHAYRYKDNVPSEIKQERASEIMRIQEAISLEKNEGRVGKIFKVLFDRKENGFFTGRTESDSPEVDNEVLVDAKSNFVRIGDFADIRITSAEAFDLHGETANPSLP